MIMFVWYQEQNVRGFNSQDQSVSFWYNFLIQTGNNEVDSSLFEDIPPELCKAGGAILRIGCDDEVSFRSNYLIRKLYFSKQNFLLCLQLKSAFNYTFLIPIW